MKDFHDRFRVTIKIKIRIVTTNYGFNLGGELKRTTWVFIKDVGILNYGSWILYYALIR